MSGSGAAEFGAGESGIALFIEGELIDAKHVMTTNAMVCVLEAIDFMIGAFLFGWDNGIRGHQLEDVAHSVSAFFDLLVASPQATVDSLILSQLS